MAGWSGPPYRATVLEQVARTIWALTGLARVMVKARWYYGLDAARASRAMRTSSVRTPPASMTGADQ